MPNQFFSPEGDIENYFLTEYWLIDQYLGSKLWNWGLNTSGQLGINIQSGSRSTPVTILNSVHNWKQVDNGNAHTLAIRADGSLWTWGANFNGQLGINNTTNRPTPVTTLSAGNNWRVVSVGGSSSYGIKTDGSLWVWGNNTYAQLGLNDANQRLTPVTVFGGGNNWKQISSSPFHTAAIKTDGSLWVWGDNGYGQLGTNDIIRISTPVTTFIGGNDWKQISCGEYHTSAIKTDGSLWTWGNNIYSQLGINDNIDRSTPVQVAGNNWYKVASGRATAVAIKLDGSLWTWGLNYAGQLGTNNSTNTIASTPVTTFLGGFDWKYVSTSTDANPSYVSAIKTDGSLWVWGENTQGQLGVNDTITRLTPVTTIIGGYNWKQSATGGLVHSAITYGI